MHDGIVVVDDGMIDSLIRNAKVSENKRARFCMHADSGESVNEMVLVMCRHSYIRPHRHPAGKAESYSVVRGEMDVLIYDDKGEIIERIEMGPPGCGKVFHYKLSAPYWHTPVPRTETVAFVEVFTGPFNKDRDVEYAPWAKAE